ncbi:MAG: hypothetical protein R3234_05905 [Thermoanaerobaculia bacterium]|nr:hypothetical protein [Thermoanaerobaculia bacterium]
MSRAAMRLGGLLVIVVFMLYDAIHHAILHAETGTHLEVEEQED